MVFLKKRTAWNKQNLSIICIVCGKKVKANKYQIEVAKKKTCSRECFRLSRIGKTAWNKGKGKNSTICPDCKGKKVYQAKHCRKCKSKYFVPKTAFKKGSIPWNKGKKLGFTPVGTFKKNHNTWNKGKHHIEILGKNHWNWKGGITPIHRALRNSFKYEEWRKQVFERDLYTCQDCGQIGGYLHADHIKRFADYPELRFDVNNGQTLCIECHDIKTKIEGKTYWKNQYKQSLELLINKK